MDAHGLGLAHPGDGPGPKRPTLISSTAHSNTDPSFGTENGTAVAASQGWANSIMLVLGPNTGQPRSRAMPPVWKSTFVKTWAPMMVTEGRSTPKNGEPMSRHVAPLLTVFATFPTLDV